MTGEQVSFQAHLVPRIYSLPGPGDDTYALRLLLCFLLGEPFPAGTSEAIGSLGSILKRIRDWNTPYIERYPGGEGKLVADYLDTVMEAGKAAKSYPFAEIGVEHES